VADANGDTAFDQEAFPDLPPDWQARQPDDSEADTDAAVLSDGTAQNADSGARPPRVVMMTDLR
jgi:hypothetical protein